jgi:hypothetical protein
MTQKIQPTTDNILRQIILVRFAANERIASANLQVGVSNGIIHLAGCLALLEDRQLADDLAASIPGGRGVVNRIETPGAPSPARTVNLHITDKKGNMHE